MASHSSMRCDEAGSVIGTSATNESDTCKPRHHVLTLFRNRVANFLDKMAYRTTVISTFRIGSRLPFRSLWVLLPSESCRSCISMIRSYIACSS